MVTASPNAAFPGSTSADSVSGESVPGSSASDKSDDIRALSYEQARDELVRVVNELEQGSATLEQSLALWERGEALAKRCEEWLLGAKARLDAARAAAAE
ncbi:exodeoxyribonuclease VII small subunit [Glaciihabitans tibetensis]|uniref:Exodeoxyribonuclease 7 small subunit n=1 Tax=Glaciihabitans tibetensis TaxID=1266600 RepID=A0A2T0VGK0_9MICO|nr:exodeoxyribonuclease VII small subunit [Glaciihabitans tibetensis]PRY69334.1 exodeoxyribonuclease VII small subunit [Glaciihabitans tibetensis]